MRLLHILVRRFARIGAAEYCARHGTLRKSEARALRRKVYDGGAARQGGGAAAVLLNAVESNGIAF
jgi:hypothetical protein